ncbi:ankyrin repeat domain-containing protein 31-like isoform X2 [Patiria miniata]|uniref:Protein kinase domain-containing protein n=1 Tax=Patiria miniata TaxID=46514 RepID=A0A913YYK0_PATMI|nr:ankyrin repeat domain-containing protein 31-like isoform X2 [Patiria miniata]
MSELILAAKRGLYHRVLAEVREGAVIDARDNEEATPLYWAACGGHSDICRLLLSKGADTNLAVQWGSTPLHAAADRGHTDCIKYLLRYGADVNAQNNNGDTPLHLASFRGHKEACVILVAHGADHNILNNHGKTSHQEAQGAQHRDITKIFSDKKTASKDVVMTRQRLRASDSDDSLLRAKKTSLRKNLLASSLEKQVEMREKPGTRAIPSHLNQLSDDASSSSAFHHHHRPFSDPTPAFLGRPLNIEEFSDPAKLDNILSEETDFHHRQEETERDHYIVAIDSLQLKVALLTSQKEALEMQLREGGGSPSQELIRKELEQKLGGVSIELEKQRHERRASDARSRQLAMELFRLKHSQEHQKRPSMGDLPTYSSSDTSVGTESLISEYKSLCRTKQNTERSLTKSICSYLQKPYLCQDSSLEHVFALMQEGKAAIQILKTSTTKRLCMIRSSLNDMKDELSSDETGKQWTLEEDYKVMDGRPVDRELKQSEDGLISQMCIRVLCKDQTYIMKILMNHRRSPKPPTHQCTTDSLGAEFSVLNSLHEAPHPHITRICHHFDIPTSELRNLFDVSSLLGSAHSGQLSERTAMVIFPDYCTTLDHLVSSLGVDRPSSHRPTQNSNEVFVLRLLLQLLKALSYLRANGVAHRDINAKAVVIDWNMRLVLGEFGHARKLQNDEGQGIPFVEKSQISAGNPLAWSPELLQYSIHGPPKSWQKVLTLMDVYESSDMYSAAAMLCDLFTKLPVEESSPPLPEMTAHSLPGVCTKPPGFLSSEAQALFDRLLRDNPAERPTLQEATLRTGMLLYGPRLSAVNSAQDVDAWVQAQDIRMLATPPLLDTRELDELARRLDWELCHDHIHSVSTSELWQLCNDPLVG